MVWTGRQPSRSVPFRFAVALAVAAGPALAAGLDWTLQLEPAYSYVTDRTTGSVEVSDEASLLSDRFRATLGQEFLPKLRLDLTGYLNWLKGWRRTNGVWSDSDDKQWNGDARLSLGSNPLSAQFFYTYRQNSSESSGMPNAPDHFNESFGATANWTPLDLPRFALLVNRAHVYDETHQAQDLVSDSLFLAADYVYRKASLRYAFSYGANHDLVTGVRGETLGHAGQVAWGDAFLDNRLSLAAGYSVTTSTARAYGGSAGATLPLQQIPQGGLSIVEPPTSTPDHVKLAPTPALVDGIVDTKGGANGGGTPAAGLDIGFGPSAGGDTRFRDAGASFSDPLTQVDLIYLYVDRRLPTEVWTAYQWSVYRSDDNENWTLVTIAGPVQFGTFDARFEIPIASTRAPYFKVVTRPLAVGVTVDRQYETVLVTEIQLFRKVSAKSSGPAVTTLSQSAVGSLRYLILPSINLAYDASTTVFFRSNPDRVDWTFQHGLSATRALNQVFIWRARLDESLGKVRLASGEALQNDLRLTTGVDAAFLPTLRASGTYQSQISFERSDLSRTYNAVLLNASAEPYKGIGLLADTTYTRGRDNKTDDQFENIGFDVSGSINPHAGLTLTGTFSYASTHTWGEFVDNTSKRGLIVGGIVYAPLPALYLSASVTRLPWVTPPTTLLNLAASFSPLPGGTLLLGFQYNQSDDFTNDTQLQTWGANARWTIRRATFLSFSFTQSRSDYPTYRTVTNGIFASLLMTL